MATGSETAGEYAGELTREDDEQRRGLLERIAELWRGDWSGHVFDGRDGKRWIMTALDGDARQLAALDCDLAEIEKSY